LSSSEGRLSKHPKYIYIKHVYKDLPQGFRIYHPMISNYVSYFRLYEAFLEAPSKVKVLSVDSKDVTEKTLKKCKPSYDAQIKRQTNAEKLKKIKADLKSKSGYFCDCALSSRYKHPKFIPKRTTDEDRYAMAKSTKVLVDSNKNCAFCGYAAVFIEAKPTQKQIRGYE